MRRSLLALSLVACYLGPVDEDGALSASSASPTGSADGGTTMVTPADGNAKTSGMPCDVAQALTRNKCLDCHGTVLSAPMPLLSRGDLLAVAKSDASKKVAELVVLRMRSTASPMPPAPSAPAPQPDIGVLERWIAAGYPEGTCGQAADASAPQQTEPMCTSGEYWRPGPEAPEMNPGRACVSCHQNENARRRRERAPAGIGGTVYPSLHEPDLCFGVSGDATVVITDARNLEYRLPVNATGNFYLYGTVAFPIQAKVVSAGKERKMNSPQMTGDCNSCHTASGTRGAPGRIMLP